MTDKQIIINGCNVSGCEWIREIELDSEYICTCNSPNKTSGYCKDNPNCCYKQLIHKEQECEILLGQLVINDGEDVTVQISQSQFEEYNQLKTELNIKEQECEMFKRALKNKTDEYNKLAVNYDAYVYMAKKKLQEKEQECEKLKEQVQYLEFEIERISEQC